MSEAERILVVGPSWVGDMVMSQVLYRLLAATRPGVEIDVLAPAWSEPILARMPGDHCYAFFSGLEEFRLEHESELGTFYLTDFLAKHHEALVFGALGLDEHPELIPVYFGNYTRLLYLAQDPTDDLTEAARTCANRLNLRFDQSNVGRGLLETRVRQIRRAA